MKMKLQKMFKSTVAFLLAVILVLPLMPVTAQAATVKLTYTKNNPLKFSVAGGTTSNKNDLAILSGDSCDLKTAVYNAMSTKKCHAYDKNSKYAPVKSSFTFKSSKSSVASVSKKGVLKAKAVGTAKVTVKFKAKLKSMKNITVVFNVTVSKPDLTVTTPNQASAAKLDALLQKGKAFTVLFKNFTSTSTTVPLSAEEEALFYDEDNPNLNAGSFTGAVAAGSTSYDEMVVTDSSYTKLGEELRKYNGYINLSGIGTVKTVKCGGSDVLYQFSAENCRTYQEHLAYVRNAWEQMMNSEMMIWEVQNFFSNYCLADYFEERYGDWSLCLDYGAQDSTRQEGWEFLINEFMPQFSTCDDMIREMDRLSMAEGYELHGNHLSESKADIEAHIRNYTTFV